MLLRELGVDIDQLGVGDYSQKLVDTRIKRFCKVYKDLKKKTDDLKIETGFDTQLRRSGSLIDIS